ncbi:MAG: hypothetical protein ACYC7F_05440 [Gemmatimonadaceae bacterium]
MGWFTKSPPRAAWQLKSATRSPFEPRNDGGLSFSSNGKGHVHYNWLYVTLQFDAKPTEEALSRFTLRRGSDDHAGRLLGYTTDDAEATLCFTGDWAETTGLCIGDDNQTAEIADVVNAKLPF